MRNYSNACGRVACGVCLLALAIGSSGCSILGLAASKGTRTFITPSYKRLAGESIGVIVTADPGTLIDYPSLQLDVAQAIQAKMIATQKNKADELKETTFPPSATPATIFAYQRDHPESELDSMTTIAPRFGASRLISIELDLLSLNPADVLELFRGEASGRVKVVEVVGGTATNAFDDELSAVFPDKSPPEGDPTLNRAITYRGLVDAIATTTVRKFVAYETN